MTLQGDVAVRIVKPWRHYREGKVIYPPRALREFLLKQGFVAVAQEPESVETAMASQPETATVKRRKGRRRKGAGR
jgi:hypothetical protein